MRYNFPSGLYSWGKTNWLHLWLYLVSFWIILAFVQHFLLIFLKYLLTYLELRDVNVAPHSNYLLFITFYYLFTGRGVLGLLQTHWLPQITNCLVRRFLRREKSHVICNQWNITYSICMLSVYGKKQLRWIHIVASKWYLCNMIQLYW